MIRRPSKVTDRAAVLKAIKRCDEMGRETFRDHYGYGISKGYFLRYEGKTYDSKAIIGVAYGYQHGTKPLRHDEFSGGAARVQPVLQSLEFSVINFDKPDEQPEYASELLSIGEVYSREQLKEKFTISDATINNGVFRPRGTKSIWLFVTEDKTADRPQLVDKLVGDNLSWQGQPAGRTDQMIIDHLANGDELLLFYRKNRQSHPNGGFIYEGPFVYQSHHGAKPTSFTLVRDATALLTQPADENEGAFNPKNLADGRRQVLALVRQRQGQQEFRSKLLKAYSSTCAISRCEVVQILEAAHIYPYRGTETNHVTNGILLRADIHTLFDLGLITINDDGTLNRHQSLMNTEYAKFTHCQFPAQKRLKPSKFALQSHRNYFAK